MTKTDTKMEAKSLHDIMNALARDGVELSLAPARAVSIPALEEALAVLDPLLAGLQKQMLDAVADHRRVRTKHGAADFMSAVATDRADSARCAFETRLLELKIQRPIMIEARALMRQTTEMAEQARRDQAMACLQRLKLAMDAQCARIRDKKKRCEQEEQSFLYYMLLLWILTPVAVNYWMPLRQRFSHVSALQEAV